MTGGATVLMRPWSGIGLGSDRGRARSETGSPVSAAASSRPSDTERATPRPLQPAQHQKSGPSWLMNGKAVLGHADVAVPYEIECRHAKSRKGLLQPAAHQGLQALRAVQAACERTSGHKAVALVVTKEAQVAMGVGNGFAAGNDCFTLRVGQGSGGHLPGQDRNDRAGDFRSQSGGEMGRCSVAREHDGASRHFPVRGSQMPLAIAALHGNYRGLFMDGNAAFSQAAASPRASASD